MWDKLDGHLHWPCNVNERFPYLVADMRADVAECTSPMGTAPHPMITSIVAKVLTQD